MTKAEVEQALERAQKATPGPGLRLADKDWFDFLASARSDVPALCRDWLEKDQQLAKLKERPKWRCFHCGFETADDSQAEAHFGQRDDPEEYKPLCRWWANMTPEERGDALQDVIQQLNDTQAEAATQAAEIERLKAALAFMYDQWEGGTPCFESPEEMDGPIGNAFKLNYEDENIILGLIEGVERGSALSASDSQQGEKQCSHDRLDEDGICRQCGADKRGI